MAVCGTFQPAAESYVKRVKLIAWTLWILVSLVDATPNVASEYCQGEEFEASCAEGEAIVMTQAYYGRMQFSRCVSNNYYVGCYANVLQHLDGLCSGRRACKVMVDDLSRHRPCRADLPAYLEASYTCVSVRFPAGFPSSCQSTEAITQTSGYIASYVTEDTGCGGEDTPWLINLPLGMMINFTLWDFNSTQASAYAIIKQPDTGSLASVYSTGWRTSAVLTTNTNSAEVQIVSTLNNITFMLEYQPVGCPEITPPAGTIMQNTGMTIQIACMETVESWELLCYNGEWQGNLGTCTQIPGEVRNPDIAYINATDWATMMGIFRRYEANN